MAIARQMRTMNGAPLSVASVVEDPQLDPGQVDGASAARMTPSSDDVSSSMIEPTVANSDPVPSRGPRSALPRNRSRAASYALRGTSPEPRDVSPCLGPPPDAVGAPGGAALVPGGDVGAGPGADEEVGAGDDVGSGLGSWDGSDDGDGSGLGSGEGEGFGGFVGFGGFEGFGPLSSETCVVRSTDGSVRAAIADDMALRMRAIVKRATALACTTRLLRCPLGPLTTARCLPAADHQLMWIRHPLPGAAVDESMTFRGRTGSSRADRSGRMGPERVLHYLSERFARQVAVHDPVTASRMTSSDPGCVRSIQTMRCCDWPNGLQGASIERSQRGSLASTARSWSKVGLRSPS